MIIVGAKAALSRLTKGGAGILNIPSVGRLNSSETWLKPSSGLHADRGIVARLGGSLSHSPGARVWSTLDICQKRGRGAGKQDKLDERTGVTMSPVRLQRIIIIIKYYYGFPVKVRDSGS